MTGVVVKQNQQLTRVCVCLCVCVSVCLCVCVSVCLWVCLWVCLCLSRYSQPIHDPRVGTITATAIAPASARLAGTLTVPVSEDRAVSASFSNLRVLASPGEVVSVQLSAGGGGVPPLVANVTVMSCGVGQGMISGSTTCQVCGAGYTSNGAACQACPRGTVASVAGSPACSACEAGKYAAEPGLAVCEICPGGVWGIGASISANCSGPCLEGYCTSSRCRFTVSPWLRTHSASVWGCV